MKRKGLSAGGGDILAIRAPCNRRHEHIVVQCVLVFGDLAIAGSASQQPIGYAAIGRAAGERDQHPGVESGSS